jgi:hypothetical protein
MEGREDEKWWFSRNQRSQTRGGLIILNYGSGRGHGNDGHFDRIFVCRRREDKNARSMPHNSTSRRGARVYNSRDGEFHILWGLTAIE